MEAAPRPHSGGQPRQRHSLAHQNRVERRERIITGRDEGRDQVMPASSKSTAPTTV